MSSLLGTTIGHIRVVDVLGEGGMGSVYVGFDEALQRRVALKAIRAEQRLNAETKSRFLREARILSQLDHPNICRIYDYVEDDDRDFLVLELIEGEHLKRALSRGIDRAAKLRLAEQVAQVLAAAHAEGVVHRDLKPENVMLTPGGEVKVLDFGLAGSVATADDSTLLSPGLATGTVSGIQSASWADLGDGLKTRHGSIMGTPRFMSPEQARGEPATTASDMYSFGVLLQELFTGKPAYDSSLGTAQVLAKARKGETLPVTGLGADLTKLIERLKLPAPAARPTAVDSAMRLRFIRDKPKRRLRRLAVVAALVAIALGGLKYTLDLKEARDMAERRRDQAQGLIGFMLGDLREKLEPVGRLEILDDVADRAMAYFESVPEEELTTGELFRRSSALRQIGQVRWAQGRLTEALTALRDALGLAEDLVRRDPQNDEWQKGLGECHFWIGHVYRRRGEMDAARDSFKAYLTVASSLALRDPTRAEWQLELAYAHGTMGQFLEASGDLQGALGEFQTFLSGLKALAAGEPENLALQKDLADAHRATGIVYAALGRPQEALDSFRADLSIKRRLVQRDPTNTHWQASLSSSHNFVGRALRDRGDLEEAHGHFRLAVEILEGLVAGDPENSRWERNLAVIQGDLGLVLRARGDVAGGRRQHERFATTMEKLTAADPVNAGWQKDLARARILLAGTLLAEGEGGAARREGDLAAGVIRQRLAGSPDDRDAQRLLGEAEEMAGQIWEAEGDGEKARAAWERSLAALEPLAGGSSDKDLLVPWARVLLRLERAEQARPVVGKLVEMGYREPSFLDLCSRKGVLPRGAR